MENITSYANIMIIISLTLFGVALILFLTFIFKEKELTEERNGFASKKFTTLLLKKNEKKQKKQFDAVKNFVKNYRFRVLFGKVGPIGFKKASIFYGISVITGIVASVINELSPLIISCILSLIGTWYLVDDILYYIGLSRLLKEDK